jgi:hypothetical protein
VGIVHRLRTVAEEIASRIPAKGFRGSKELADLVKSSSGLKDIEDYIVSNKTLDPFRQMDTQYKQFQGQLPDIQLQENRLRRIAWRTRAAARAHLRASLAK